MKYLSKLVLLLPTVCTALNVMGSSLFNTYDCSCIYTSTFLCFHNVLITENTISECSGSTNDNFTLKVNFINYDSEFILENIQDKVTALNIRSITSDTFQSELLRFSRLQRLTITKGEITSFSFDSIKSLKQLIYLDISENEILITKSESNFKLDFLQTLKLDLNDLEVIYDNFFIHFPNLTTLSLSFNNITKLYSHTFENLENLVHLNLSNNKIETLDLSLSKLVNLETLQLDHNLIKTFQEQDFMLNKLKVLTISYNLINDVDNNMFSNLNSLEEVNLSHNNIEYIDNELFGNSKKLSTIDISYNNIKYITPNVFKTHNIKQFNIEGNKLEIALQEGIFTGFNRVDSLDLSNQHIDSIEDFVFKGIESLLYLNISNNNLKLLSSQSLKFLDNLNTLDLSHNQLFHYDIDLNYVKNLKWLSLKNNRLGSINYNILMLSDLTHLDVSYNHITKFEPNFEKTSKLLVLDMSNNLITILKNDSFNKIINLEIVNFSNCKINELEYDVFKENENLSVINLSSNRLTLFNINTKSLKYLKTLNLNNNMIRLISDQTLTPLRNLYHLYVENNTLNEPLNLSNNIYISNINLQFNSDKNICFNMSFANNHYINTITLVGINGIANNTRNQSMVTINNICVTHSEITEISQLNLQGLNYFRYIKLVSNKITKIEKDNFASQIKAVDIDLSDNYISFIQPGSFKGNVNLQCLNISHNRLTNIDYGTFEGLSSMLTLDLSFNSILSIQFATTLSIHSLILDNNSIEDISSFYNAPYVHTIISIGNNEIPCDALTHTHKSLWVPNFTALKLDYHSENIKGITCKGKKPDKVNTNTMSPELVSALNNLSIDIRNLSIEIHEHMHEEVVRGFEMNVTDVDNVTVKNKSKHHSLSQIYDSIKSENVNILSLIESVKGELGLASQAIIFLSVIIGILILLSFVFVAIKYVNFNYICYRFRSNSSTTHNNVDYVEMES